MDDNKTEPVPTNNTIGATPPSPPQQDVEPTKKSRNLFKKISKKHVVLTGSVLVLVAASSFLTYTLTHKKDATTNATQSEPTNNTGNTKAVTEKEIETTKKEISFTWQTPKAVAALPLYEDLDAYYASSFEGDSEASGYSAQHKYYLVGTGSDGTKAYVTTSPAFAIGPENALFVTEKDGAYTIYQQHSEGWFYAAKDGEAATYQGPKLSGKAVVDTKTVIAEIENKAEITYKGQKLATAGGFNSSLRFLNKDVPTAEGGTTSYTKVADMAEGTLYEFVQVDDPSYKIGNFYLVYKNHMSGSFVVNGELSKTKIDPITWTDNSKNADDYASVGRGCGISGANEIAKGVTKDQLQQIGKSDKGQPVYGFKATSALLVSKHYTEYADAGADFYEEGDKNLTLDQFIARRPIYLVEDSLSRWLVFSNLKYVPQGGCAKPVVYLYPTKTQFVNVSVGADVSVSVPHYASNGWQNVLASPSGQLFYQGQHYDSLFWEGYAEGQYPVINKGVIVAKSDVVATWQKQLAKLNLNQKEINDFVAFWQPRIPSSPYVRISWLTTTDLQRLAPLYVSGGVDTLIRVFLDMEGVQVQQPITPQLLVGIKRTGFTVVEWGGLVQDGSIPKLR